VTPVRFLDEAENDLKQAYEWYSSKDSDLALQFIMCVRQTVDAIEKSPLRYPVAVADIRKASVAKFPFSVWYVTDGESVIIACLHGKRNPNIALERLRTLGPAPEQKISSSTLPVQVA